MHSVFFIFTHMCKSVKNFKYKCILLRDHAEIQSASVNLNYPYTCAKQAVWLANPSRVHVNGPCVKIEKKV